MGWELASATTYAVEGDTEDPRSWVGRVIETEAPYEVNAAQIGFFCSLVEDPNPHYWYPDRAAEGRYRSIISPPGMLMVWMFPTPWHPDGRPEHGPLPGLEIPLPVDTLINVATDTRFLAPMRVGDRLGYRHTITAVSAPKDTALGRGWFVTTMTETANQDGVVVATNENVIFRYRATAPIGDDGGPTRDDRPEGEPLPAIEMTVDASVAALNAGATRDYFPGHHDPAYAQAQGVSSTYLNTMCFHGLADRVAQTWSGPDGWIARRTLRMKVPAVAGRPLVMRPTLLPGDGPVRDVHVDFRSGDVSAAESVVTVDTDGWRG